MAPVLTRPCETLLSLTVSSPPTALCLLERFVDLQEGDVVVQNGANSSVGQVGLTAAQKCQ